MARVEIIKGEPSISEVPSIKQEPPDEFERPNMSEFLNLKYEFPCEAKNPGLLVSKIKQKPLYKFADPNIPEVPNVKFEPTVSSKEPGKVKIKNSSSIMTEPGTESQEDLQRSSGQIISNESATESSTDEAHGGGTFGGRDGCKNPRDQSYNEQLQEPNVCHMCSICSKTFAFNRYLQSHLRTHQAVRPFQCKSCPKSFVKGRDLDAHEINHHGKEKKYKCPQCPRSFARTLVMQNHLRTHSHEKVLICEICNTAFQSKKSLKAHKVLCKGTSSNQVSDVVGMEESEKTQCCHTCPICSKTFTFSRYLQNHLRTHQDVRPFQCKSCPKSFVKGRDLDAHEINHHGEEKKYTCPKCPRSFACKLVMENHLRKHSDDNTTACGNCGSTFKTKRNLADHRRRSCKGTSLKKPALDTT